MISGVEVKDAKKSGDAIALGTVTFPAPCSLFHFTAKLYLLCSCTMQLEIENCRDSKMVQHGSKGVSSF